MHGAVQTIAASGRVWGGNALDRSKERMQGPAQGCSVLSHWALLLVLTAQKSGSVSACLGSHPTKTALSLALCVDCPVVSDELWVMEGGAP